MSHKAHEQLPTPPSCSLRSGASREASKRWGATTAAALLTFALGQIAQAADGQLDASFGDNGRVTLDVDERGGQDHLAGVVLLPDGRIAVGGHTRARSLNDPPDLDFVVAAFSSINGSLDTGFGTSGLTTTDISGPQPALDEASALVRQDDGKIVLVGRSGPSGSRQFTAVRYQVGGLVDPGFGILGVVETLVPGGPESIASDVAVQTDGKIILAGEVGGDNHSRDIALVRYNRDGSLDDNDEGGVDDGGLPDHTPGDKFGSNGTVRTSFGGSQFAFASAVVVQGDGKIVAGGGADLSDPNTQVDFALVRYNRDGSLDDGGPLDTTPGDKFGRDGKITTGFGSGRDDSVADLVLQPDGKIVAGGTSSIDKARLFALARYNADGTIDQTFGTGGTTTTDFPRGFGGSMAALVVQPGGKLVAAGSATTGSGDEPGDVALVRYQPNGCQDTTFGDDVIPDLGAPAPVLDGIKLAHFGSANINTAARGQDVALQSDGKIVVAGFFRSDPKNAKLNDFALARYQSSVVPANLTCQGRPPTVIGTPGDDILVGTPSDDVIEGLGGNDTIIAQDGNDTICGGPGDDRIFGGFGDDAIEGGDGFDELNGDGDPRFVAGGNDTLRGGEGDDSLFGAAGSDRLEGDAGNDELVGGPGDDSLNGGSGDDRVFGEDGGDTLAGDPGNDTLVGDDPFAGTGGPDVLSGGEGDDRLFGAAGNDQLEGDAGNDELVGGPGDDVLLNGGPGNDTLVGGPGEDMLNGGPDVDLLSGEGGADTLDGDSGDDTLIGDDLVADAGSPDVLRGGEGDDKLFGAAGNDQLFGDAGQDELNGGPGNDQLDGGAGIDGKLFGGSGNDTIRGGPGPFKDRLVGDAGRDELRGGPGNDQLFGGPGRDRLFGGAGNDRMDGQGGQDSGHGGRGPKDQCFSIVGKGSCETNDNGSRPKAPSPPPLPPLPVPSTPGSSNIPPVCNFPQCGA